ncbi:MAG: ribbon-helix-helix protein, CopG family [Armatimonadota bacterium]
MVRTQIQLTEKQANELKEIAAHQGVSMAEVIRRCVDRMLVTQRIPDDEEIRRRAIGAVGFLHSGTGDLSEKHDEYLEEAFKD